ncbi:protein-export chaperone SecB [Streptomyces coelicolor]|nr:protein-export chaperone SecB [Streptomyces coelicolor]
MTAQPADASDRFDQAEKLHESAELVGIRLQSLEAKVLDRGVKPPYQVQVDMEPSCKVGRSSATYQIRYSVKAKKEDEPVFTLDFTYEARYSHSLEKVPREAIAAFGDIVVLATLHPYVRELTQRISLDLGFPAFVLDNLDTKDLFQLLKRGEIYKRGSDETYS